MAFVYPTGSAAALVVTQVEVDFGTTPTTSKSFVVTDAAVSASSNILLSQSGEAATGKSADENELDVLVLWASPGSGSFTLFIESLNGPVVGKFLINYVVG